MSAKRSHTKSRLGCRTCKQRKVKCNEERPVCGNCAKRFPHLKECEFDPIQSWPGSTVSTTAAQAPTPCSTAGASPAAPATTTPTPSAPVTIHLPSTPRPYDARLLDLRLFHQWTSSTAATYTSYLRHPVMNAWIEQLPSWAFTHSFVLDFMLAFAALHLWRLDPDANAEMKSAYLYYVAAAGLGHREELSSVTAANAEPLFVAAMLTNLQAKILPLLRAPDEPYELPMAIFSLIRGMMATYDAVQPLLREDQMRQIRDLGPMLWPDGVDLRELGFLPAEEREDVEMLLRVIDEREGEGGSEGDGDGAETGAAGAGARADLRAALSMLVSVQFGWAAHEPETWTLRRVNFWTARVAPGYVRLLEAQDPVAMAVLARFFCQTRDRQEWFLRGTAESEVVGIASLMPREMRWLVDYPLKLVGR